VAVAEVMESQTATATSSRGVGRAVPAVLDLASLASVRAFAGEYLASGAPLDVLVCNAVSGGGVLKRDSVRRIYFAEPTQRARFVVRCCAAQSSLENAKTITTFVAQPSNGGLRYRRMHVSSPLSLSFSTSSAPPT
jgi:hypothetical protein